MLHYTRSHTSVNVNTGDNQDFGAPIYWHNEEAIKKGESLPFSCIVINASLQGDI